MAVLLIDSGGVYQEKIKLPWLVRFILTLANNLAFSIIILWGAVRVKAL